ncbi:hypothetical protein TNCV_4178001 [Trichonephila clavipes]|nr:hypothetical protein TNCV_4178001 [Trichonephila clavipes]
MTIVNSYILWSLMHGEKTSYYNNLKSFWLDLITGLVSIGRQKFPEKRFASYFYSGLMKLKFMKPKVSEKDRLKNVGHMPNQMPIQKVCLLQYQSETSQNEMDVL